MDIVESDSARLVFGDTPPGFTVSEFRAAIDGINNAYEFLSIGVLPGYEQYPLSDRVAPRIHSRLAKPDELRITSLTYGSPLDLILHGVPFIVPAVASLLGGGIGLAVLKDGGDSLASWLNVVSNVRSKHAKFQADAAEDRLRRARNEKALEALRTTDRGGRGDDQASVQLDSLPSVARDNVDITTFLVEREVTKVIRVAGRPDKAQVVDAGIDGPSPT
jgi:hypothetical protein